jgi:hypothetical protein
VKVILLLLFLSSVAVAEVKSEFSGNVEAQGRFSWNNDEAKKDLLQKWNQENFYLLFGNLSGKFDFGNSRVETNWFVRHSYSKLWGDNYLAPQIFNFPNRLVARDIFKLQYIKQENNYQTESILNKLFYELDIKDNKLLFGRMYINYGQGEIFNPINPFNQPTGLTAISQIAQGNDGIAFKYFMNDAHTMDFFLLGDKRFNGYDGKITRTLWVHGEVQASEKLQLDYVFGEDQKRDKIGGQANYRFEEAMVFAQVLYQSEYVNLEKDRPSTHLWDVLLGFDQQLTAKWHIRTEGGYQKNNPYVNLATFGERFLPTEYFVALANQVEVHPLVKLTGTVINDLKSGFTYLIAKSTFDIGHSMEAEVYGYTPMAKGDGADNPSQKLVTSDIGVAVRAFF